MIAAVLLCAGAGVAHASVAVPTSGGPTPCGTSCMTITNTSPSGAGITGVGTGVTGYGVTGNGTGTSGIGVKGSSPGATGFGLWGNAPFQGVHGEGGTFGVEGWTGSSSATAAGLHGTTTDATGVLGESWNGNGVSAISHTGTALKASTPAAGQQAGFFENTAGGTALIAATNGTGSGVYTQNFSANGWALNADGRGYILGGVWTSSDPYLKANIADSVDGVAKLKLLHAKAWTWKDEKNGMGPQRGFLADDVAAVFPDMVSTRADRDGVSMRVMRYEALIPVVVKAVQEQQDEIDMLKREIGLLKAAVNP